MKKALLHSGMAAGMLLLSGCATVIHGSKQEVSISSVPTQANVTIDDKPEGVTPLVALLPRKRTHQLKITLDGYLPYEISFSRNVDGWIAGNIVIGGLLGLGIDALTGGMYKLTPSQVSAELRKGTASVIQKNGGLYCAVVLQADAHWQKIGQLTPSGL